MALVKTWVTIGPPDSRGNYSKQTIFCKIANKEVTLTAQSNGIIVCNEWRKCGSHMKRGVKPCPVIVAEAILKKLSNDKKIRFVEEKAKLLKSIEGFYKPQRQ